MSQPISSKDFSLKSLEVFQICAVEGSLQAASNASGLSISTISHHIRSLEDHLGIELFDRNRRPMALTLRGQTFLKSITPALDSIRQAKAEAVAGGAAEARRLRLGTIEDVDSDIVPLLAVYMSRSMPSTDLNFHTDTSHALIQMLRNRQLDVALTTRPTDGLSELVERPLLKDPFVVILPAGADESLADIVAGRISLPFLRFSSGLIIARQINAQLKRMGMTPTHRIECNNNQTIMAMVASGAGWSISTPLLYARAKRFQRKVRMHEFPGKSFSRTLSLFATSDCSKSIFDLIERKTRDLVEQHTVAPLIGNAAWLQERFHLLD